MKYIHLNKKIIKFLILLIHNDQANSSKLNKSTYEKNCITPYC